MSQPDTRYADRFQLDCTCYGAGDRFGRSILAIDFAGCDGPVPWVRLA